MNVLNEKTRMAGILTNIDKKLDFIKIRLEHPKQMNFIIEGCETLKDVQQEIRRHLSNCQKYSLSMHWKDNEGDSIHILLESDWDIYLRRRIDNSLYVSAFKINNIVKKKTKLHEKKMVLDVF